MDPTALAGLADSSGNLGTSDALTGLLTGSNSGSGNLTGGNSFDPNMLKSLMNDPQFMAALQLMMSKQQPDMMKVAQQMYAAKPGGLGGLGGM